MRRLAINLAAGAASLAACAVMAGDLSAEATNDRQHSAWPEEQDSREKTPLSKWLPSVLPGLKNQAQPDAPPESEPAAADPAPPPPRQQRARRAPEPEPEPEPKLTREEQEAEDRWWQATGDPAVATFSRCLAEHVIDETSRGSQASYPEFVTAAMNGPCSREFASMAQVILDRHGEENFARIARKLIATKFVPAVKQVVEVGPSEAIPPEDEKPALEAEMRRSKEAMLGCMMDQADRLAAGSAASVEQVADGVIAACRTPAEAFFGKLERLYPGTTGGEASAKLAAIIESSYRPAIVQRIASVRGGPAEDGGSGGAVRVGKADAETAVHKRQEAASQHSRDAESPPAVKPQAIGPQAIGPQIIELPESSPAAINPAGVPAPGSPVPASSRP